MTYSTSYAFLQEILYRTLFNNSSSRPDNILTDIYAYRVSPHSEPAVMNLGILDFMEGPGRFALPSMFEAVQAFFENAGHLAPGGYTLDMLTDALGLSTTADRLIVEQWRFADGTPDLAMRTLVWSNTHFVLGSDVEFVVPEMGDPYIKNLVVLPRNYTNSFLLNDLPLPDLPINLDVAGNIDPSGIGDRVVFSFSSELLPSPVTYTLDDFMADQARERTLATTPADTVQLAADLVALLAQLRADGTTDFTDSAGRLVIYGTQYEDTLAPWDLAESLSLDPAIWPISLHDSGLHLIGGDDNDRLFGTTASDVLQGNDGEDMLAGGDGDDILLGGENSDRLYGGSGNDYLIDLYGNDYFEGGDGSDVIVGGWGREKMLGEEGDDIIFTSPSILPLILDMPISKATAMAMTPLELSADEFTSGGAGNDIVVGSGGGLHQGDEGDDILIGSWFDYLEGGPGADWFVINDNFVTINDASTDDRLFLNLNSLFRGHYPSNQLVLFPLLGGFLFRAGWEDPRQGLASEGSSFDNMAFLHVHDLTLPGTDVSVNLGITYELVEGDLLITVFEISEESLEPGYAEYGIGDMSRMETFTADGEPLYEDVLVNIVIKDFDEGGDLGMTFVDSVLPGFTDGVPELDQQGVETILAHLPALSNDSSAVVGPELPDLDEIIQLSELAPDTLAVGRGTPLAGTPGNDVLKGSDENNDISGDEGNDIIFGGDGRDWIAAGAGDDELHGGPGHDHLEGDDGNDLMQGDGGRDWLTGGPGDDTLYGGDHADHLFGDDGNDTLNGDNGTDYLNGGLGNDILHGGADEDTLDGGEGNDELYGEARNDTLWGNAGDDHLDGGGGDDVLFGGDGDDHLIGSFQSDTLSGGEGDDLLEGGTQADILDGGAGNDVLYGGNGEDILAGGDGDDRLSGGYDNDVLHGGSGNDILEGGRQFDTFVFRPGDGQDVIVDFQNNADTIDLSAFGFASVDEAMSHFAADGDDMVFTFGSDVLRIQNVHVWELPNDLLIA